MTRPIGEIGLSIKRLQARHHRALDRALDPLGLTLVQWDALRHLHRNPDASLHALARLTFQSDQSFGTLASRMIAAGLIERVPGPGRARKHRLTRKGDELRRNGSAVVDRELARSLGRLSAKQLAEFDRLLLRLVGPTDAPLAADPPRR